MKAFYPSKILMMKSWK